MERAERWAWFTRNADPKNPTAHINTCPEYFASECAAAIMNGTLAFAQQPEGWREALEKISALTVVPISEDHAAANNGKEVIRAKAIARRALVPCAMLDVAPIPGEE